MRVRLTTDHDGGICLESPFDRTFVDGLKQAIDYGGRSWDPQRKRWLISALYVTELLHYLHQVGVEVQDDREGGQAVTHVPPMPEDLKEAFDALHLQYTAPLGAAEACYKFFARHWHPDAGGNAEDFHKVNDAIAIIRKYLNPPVEDGTNDDIPF